MNKVQAIQPICIEVVPTVDKLALIEEKFQSSEGREDRHDAFFLCDLGDIVKKYQLWVKTFPSITPFYAVKCNHETTVLKLLIALGTGFDCASKEEIREVLALGAQPDKIIYSNPYKQASHVRYARDNGVKLVVIDSEEELVKMKQNFPDAELVLRILVQASQPGQLIYKRFGTNTMMSQHLIDAAYEMDLKMSGISFHIGSEYHDSNVFFKVLQDARTLFDYAETVGYKFHLLDIGGGFAGADDAETTFEEIAPTVYQHICTLFPADKFQHVRMIGEPGKYFAMSAFTLATNIIAKKKVTQSIFLNDAQSADEDASMPPEEPAFRYIVNDGVHGSFSALLSGYPIPLPNLFKTATKEAPKYLSNIYGPTVNPDDIILKSLVLPELDVSDWLIWNNMGAYSLSLTSEFNGFRVSSVYYVISDDDFAVFRELTRGKDLSGIEWKVRKEQKSNGSEKAEPKK